MRKLFLLFSVGLIAGLIFLSGCPNGNGNGELTPQQERAQMLQGTWTIQSATVPQGVDPSILNGATMTFNTDNDHNPTSFNASGMPDFFSPGGSASWSFSSTINIVVLANVSPVSQFNINNVSANSLSISFSHPGLVAAADARIADLSGAYTASLTK